MGDRARGRGALGAVLIALLTGALILPASAAAAPTPLASIGSTGSGAGQLSAPEGVALDGSSNIYVAEFGNDRISVFSPAGAFIHAFGVDVLPPNGGSGFEVCTTGTGCLAGDSGAGAGQLANPHGVALDGLGNLYVVDQANHRISVFDVTVPSFTRAFGFGVDTGSTTTFEVCNTTTLCQAGVAGGGAGQLDVPAWVVIDGSGNLYVSELNNDRISVFNPATPSFTRAFGWDVAEPDGDVAFEVCPTQGACQAGDVGGFGGQLSGPNGLTLDGAGNLYVAEQVNNRISVFNPATPSFTRAFGWDVAAPNGDMAFEVCPTQGACLQGDAGGGAGQLDDAEGVALDGAGNLYVGELPNDRISVFNATVPSFTHAFGFDVVPPDDGSGFEVCTAGTGCLTADGGGAAGQLNSPRGVATDCRGAAWVADSLNNRIQRFGEPGTPLPPCPAAAGPAVPAAPSNAFTLGELKGKKLSLTLDSAGTVGVTDAAQASGASAIAAAKKRLKPSSATGGPGIIEVTLKLTKAAKQKLREEGKIKVNARITFTPTGGTANSQTAKLKIKK